MKRILIVVAFALCFAGCPTEKDAVRSLAGSKGVIESEMGKHGECNPANGPFPHTPICDGLNRAIPAQHAAVLVLDSYCSSQAYLENQGQCKPPTDPAVKKGLQIQLQTAVANLNPIIESIKQAAK